MISLYFLPFTESMLTFISIVLSHNNVFDFDYEIKNKIFVLHYNKE